MAKSRIDIETVRSAAATRWPEILSAIGGVDGDILDGKHHPCPKCGGKDRFRAFDDKSGGAFCNGCLKSKNGDGFAVLQWLTGRSFQEVAKSVAEHLGVKTSQANGKSKADPQENLEFLEWNETLVGLWCAKKQPITVQSVKDFDGRLVRYRQKYVCLGIPICGDATPGSVFKPVGWVLYNLNGKTLPKFAGKGKPIEWVKVKITAGSQSGIVGQVFRWQDPGNIKAIWKVEGVTDALAIGPVVPPDHLVIANTSGSQERPKKWITDLAKGKHAIVIHDADRPGQDGATYVGEADGRRRPGWCPEFARAGAASVRNVLLPFPVTPDHGKDLRDWLTEPNTWTDLEVLVERTESFTADAHIGPQSIESVDDPYRLARVNLNKYSVRNDGATIRYWRSEWYTWKGSRYRKISKAELRAKLSKSIKEEFDNQNIAEQERQDKDEPKAAHKVTRTLINDVVAATESISVIPDHVEEGTWIDDQAGIREMRNYVSFQNGLLELDAVLAGKDENECVLEHSPKWFNTVALPYAFGPKGKCPKWREFLAHNLEGDQERINQVQEWAGYLLLPDTGLQKFLVLEGEGANGKSVYCSAIEALLGKDNVSHVPLEIFGDRFSRTQTIGKLANIAADAGEVDKTAEGYLKSFISGEMMFFDRKGIDGLSKYPTARLMIGCNNRPRFSDRTSGIWRRMILVPWRVQIAEADQVPNMDKPWWWEQSGELPGMFNWALVGLARLRDQGHFSQSTVSGNALQDYKHEMNPAGAFLAEFVEAAEDHEFVRSSWLYKLYSGWAKESGYKALGASMFGKEVSRRFEGSKRKQKREMGSDRRRHWVQFGIRISQEAILDCSTEDTVGDSIFRE